MSYKGHSIVLFKFIYFFSMYPISKFAKTGANNVTIAVPQMKRNEWTSIVRRTSSKMKFAVDLMRIASLYL